MLRRLAPTLAVLLVAGSATAAPRAPAPAAPPAGASAGPARPAAIYARAADDRAANPEVRALARFRLAAVERARGNLQKSASQLRRLGFVGAFQVAGPFDDEGRRGHD